MSDLESAFIAWVAFHTSIGVDIKKSLLPPATEQQIKAVEEKIGYRLPSDLRDLYKIANGQLNPYDNAEQLLVGENGSWAPFFGNFEFLSLKKALKKYRAYRDMHQDNGDVIWEVREGDIIDSAGWTVNWFPFAATEYRGYSVDVAPPHGGVSGQIVTHGMGQYILSVAAPSLTDLLKQGSIKIGQSDSWKITRESVDDIEIVQFDMDWRTSFYSEETANEDQPPQAYTAWIEELDALDREHTRQFKLWLNGKGIGTPEVTNILRCSLLRSSPYPQTPEHFKSEIGEQALLMSGPGLQISEQDLQKGFYYRYIMELASGILEDKDGGFEQSISYCHEFNQVKGLWSEEQFNFFEKVKKQLGAIKNKRVRSDYSINIEGHTLEICFNDDESSCNLVDIELP